MVGRVTVKVMVMILTIIEEKLTVDAIIMMANSLQEVKMALVTSLLMLNILSTNLMIPMVTPMVGMRERIRNVIVVSIVFINVVKITMIVKIFTRKGIKMSKICMKQKRHNERLMPKKEKQLPFPSQGIEKKETKKPSIVKELQRAIELLQVKEVVGALVEVYIAMKIHVVSRGKRALKKR
ncbi:hypothetical protein M9H77_31810 [Catharanthus roseus]|uniref:Uncharacterized protein n=1 Tax=Catharanthus roseus TaxID=4058 RepID=A0ACC0A5D2_CATRO|nr:hypothetical protein M9H77_31810 [Catharanthus roseus]